MTSRTYGRVITVVGSPSVGKSALLLRILENRFNDEYIPTIARTHYFDVQHENNLYKLKILDTAGLESYSTVPSSYVIGTNGYILVYSITDRQSFETIKDIYNNLVEANNRPVPIVLVGNKSDLNNDRRVEIDEGKRLAEKWDAPFIETSAKIGDRVRDVINECLFVIDNNDPNNKVIRTTNNKPQTTGATPTAANKPNGSGGCTIS